MRTAIFAAAALIFCFVASGAQAAFAQDASAGKATFGARCGVCHQVTTAASGPTAPSLKGVVGRKIASVSDFAYSAALKGKGGKWTDAELDAFLTSPIKFAPGGKMFTAVTSPADRANLIAYLNTAK